MDRSNDMFVVVTVAPVVLDAVDEHEDRAARADIAHLVIVQVGAAALARLAAAALHGPTQPCRKYPSDMPKYAQNMPKICP